MTVQTIVSLSNAQCEFKDGEINITSLVFQGEIKTQVLAEMTRCAITHPVATFALVVRERHTSRPDFSRFAYQSSVAGPDGQDMVIVELPLRRVEFAGLVELLKEEPERHFILSAESTSSFVWDGVEIAAADLVKPRESGEQLQCQTDL